MNRNDGYQLVLSGLFVARRDGNYGFAASKQDGNDYCTIWLDKDQDGILEKNGDLGDEQVVWDNKISAVHLSRGKYRVVIAYSEWNGNSHFNARFSTPEGAGPFSLTNIHPGGPGQEGLWSTIPRVIDTSVPGQHTITYFAETSWVTARPWIALSSSRKIPRDRLSICLERRVRPSCWFPLSGCGGFAG